MTKCHSCELQSWLFSAPARIVRLPGVGSAVVVPPGVEVLRNDSSPVGALAWAMPVAELPIKTDTDSKVASAANRTIKVCRLYCLKEAVRLFRE